MFNFHRLKREKVVKIHDTMKILEREINQFVLVLYSFNSW